MNLDDINAMAEKAGAKFDHMTWVERDLAPVFYRFANLVEAKDRETVAKWMMERGYATGHGDTIEDLLAELKWQVAEQERKTCAEICRSEADRALFNFQNDLPQNEPFWNGAEQMASSCENLIKTRVSA